MVAKTTENPQREELKQKFVDRLQLECSVSPDEASDKQIYQVLSALMVEKLKHKRQHFINKANSVGGKNVYYLSMEFLMGRSLKTTLYNLELADDVRAILQDYHINLDSIFECEPDAGLGNGGLGRLATCYLDSMATQEILNKLAEKVIYTGPIDAYFNYKLGTLEYRSVRFENEILDKPNFQGNAAVNYTDRETPWTRIIEHKWFEFGKDENGNDLPKTVISREYSSEWKLGDEPYYPVNDAKNSTLYEQYKALAEAEDNVIFGGRLGEYKYYDMDKTVEVALAAAKKELP